jgi:hypothetical protein
MIIEKTPFTPACIQARLCSYHIYDLFRVPGKKTVAMAGPECTRTAACKILIGACL